MAWFPFPFSRDSSKAKLGLPSTIVCSTAFAVHFCCCLTFSFLSNTAARQGHLWSLGSFFQGARSAFKFCLLCKIRCVTSGKICNLLEFHLPSFMRVLGRTEWDAAVNRECQLLKSQFISRIMNIGLPWWLSCKESSCQCRRHEFDPWSGKIPHTAGKLSLQLLKPRNSRACAPQQESSPCLPQLEKSLHSSQHSQKKNKEYIGQL